MTRNGARDKKVPDVLSHLAFELVTKKNWDKFAGLFGENGACA